jgi:hypothetical protein
VANSLSRDHLPTTDALCPLLHSSFLKEMPWVLPYISNHDVAAQAAAFLAVTKGTHSKRNWYFWYYSTFLKWLKLDHDPSFLDTLSPFSGICVIGTFADAYWFRRFFPSTGTDPRGSGTCRDNVDAVRPIGLTGVAAPAMISAASSSSFYWTS